MDYQPELGQMCFGQPWQQRECPEKVKSALEALQAAWYAVRGNENPFSNTGAQFDGVTFKAHAYSWNDDEQGFNFAWRDVRVSWYKYLGRGTTINREMEDAEVSAMLRECIAELLGEAKAEISALRTGIDECYRMLLAEPNTKQALDKAEAMLRELMTPNAQVKRQAEFCLSA